MGIGISSSIAGIFLAATGGPDATIMLTGGPASILFASKCLRILEAKERGIP